MNCGVDKQAIEQITKNVHNKKTKILIPCITVYRDFLGTPNEFSDSAEVFFEYIALHESQGQELKQRKDPVRSFMTSPIRETMLELAEKDYQESKSMVISDATELVFSATNPALFESVMSPELSVFEKAHILKQECRDTAEIFILSNHNNIEAVKAEAEKEAGETFADEHFRIIDTNTWLAENAFKNDEITQIILDIMEKKGKKEFKFGKYMIGVGEDSNRP